MNLRRKLILFFVFVIGLLGAICIPTIYWVSGEHLKGLLFKSYAHRMDQALANINHFFSERIGDISLEAADISSLSLLERPKIEQKLKAIHATHPFYKALSIFLPTGEKIIDTEQLGLGEISHSTFLTRALKDNILILDYEPSTENSHSHFIFAKAIVSKERTLGVLVGYVDANLFFSGGSEGFDDAESMSGSEIKLIQTHLNQILFENNDKAITFDQSHLSVISSVALTSGNHRTVSVEDQSDSFVFVGERETTDSFTVAKWQMLVKVKKSDIFAPVNKIVIILGIMFAVLLAGALLGMYWLYSTLVSPLVDLSDRIRRFGHGEYDVFSEISQRTDEISMMARHLTYIPHFDAVNLPDQIFHW